MTRPPVTRRQKDILDFFEAYQARQGISPTLEEIAQHLGVNKVTIFGHVAELERKGVLVRRAPRASRALELVPARETPRPGVIPLVGTIAAGAPLDTTENAEELDMGALFGRGKDVYALRVRGDSMIEDAIRDGDVVVVESRTTPRNGEIVVAVLPNEQATLKRYYAEKGKIRLQPANAAMAPVRVKPGEVEIRGVVLGVVRIV